MSRRDSKHASAPELRRVRALLGEVGEREEFPERNVVRGAVKRLRARRTAIIHVNEFLDAVMTVMRGWTTLLSVDDLPANDTRPGANRTSEGSFGG